MIFLEVLILYGFTKISAGIPSSAFKRRIIDKVKGRFRFNTSNVASTSNRSPSDVPDSALNNFSISSRAA